MSYITPAELAERPGAKELALLGSADTQPVKDFALMDATLRGTSRAAWTPEQIAAADAALARINDAIAEAAGVIEGYLAQRGYTLPLILPPSSTGKSVLASWARAITRYLLNKNRITDESKDPVARDYRDALRMLGLLAQGKYSLGANDPVRDESVSSNTDVRFAGAETVFCRDQLSRFR